MNGIAVLLLVVAGGLILIIAVSQRKREEDTPRLRQISGFCVYCDYHRYDHPNGWCPSGASRLGATRFRDQAFAFPINFVDPLELEWPTRAPGPRAPKQIQQADVFRGDFS